MENAGDILIIFWWAAGQFCLEECVMLSISCHVYLFWHETCACWRQECITNGLELENRFIELRSDISGFAWSCHQNIIAMFCFRSSGRSVNHSGHLTLFPNSDLQPANYTSLCSLSVLYFMGIYCLHNVF